MAITLIVRPTKVTARTKDDLLAKIRNQGLWGSRKPSNFYPSRFGLVGQGEKRGLVRLYNIEKHNRKVEVTKRTITRGKRKGEVEVTRKVLKDAHWVGYYYELRGELVDKDNTRQHTRNFTLKLL